MVVRKQCIVALAWCSVNFTTQYNLIGYIRKLTRSFPTGEYDQGIYLNYGG